MSEQSDLLAPEAEAKAPIVLNTEHARNSLRQRFCAPEWALMEEVAPATGGGTRYADAVAVNLWQSRGHAIHGFEIKVSRSDWLRELKDPSKAEPVYRYCDHWWIVAPKGVVKDGELPPTWGLLELRATGLVQATAAPRLEPQPIGRSFFASLMRRGFEHLDRMADRKHRDAITRARADAREDVQRQIEQSTRRHKELEASIAKFSEETGISISRYNGPPASVIKLAQKLEALRGRGGEAAFDKLLHLAEQLEGAAQTVRQALEETRLCADLTVSNPIPERQQARQSVSYAAQAECQNKETASTAGRADQCET